MTLKWRDILVYTIAAAFLITLHDLLPMSVEHWAEWEHHCN